MWWVVNDERGESLSQASMKEDLRDGVVNKSTCLRVHRKKCQSSVTTWVFKMYLASNSQRLQLREMDVSDLIVLT